MYELLEDIPAEKQEEVLAKVVKLVVERGFTTPAIFFLEPHKPLNLVGSTILLMVSPFIYAIFNTNDFRIFALMLEKRETIEKLLCRIEEYDAEYRAKIKEQKRKKTELKSSI